VEAGGGGLPSCGELPSFELSSPLISPGVFGALELGDGDAGEAEVVV
jgi:hypothetical protein